MRESLIIGNCKEKINKLNKETNIFPNYEINILYSEEMYSEDYHQLELRYIDNNKYCRYFNNAFELANYLDGISLGIQHMKYKNRVNN